ncbi:MAG TPA: hypothetical protein VIM11_07345 [Tepidisphaeraceae bacterium]|jgi:hypothetical protein
MDSWNEITPDPDVRELANMAGQGADAKINPDLPSDPLHKPASPDDYKMNQLDAGDLMDDLTGSFDDEIGPPRK